jgi:hypothetical protein
VAGELRLVAANLLDEALGVLATDVIPVLDVGLYGFEVRSRS